MLGKLSNARLTRRGLLRYVAVGGVVAGREDRYIAPGIGVVLTRMDGATETTYLELVDYRIIP